MNIGRYKLKEDDWFAKQYQIMLNKINDVLKDCHYIISESKNSLNVEKHTKYFSVIVYTGSKEKVYAFLYGMHESLFMAKGEEFYDSK